MSLSRFQLNALAIVGIVVFLVVGLNFFLALGNAPENEVHVETHWGETTGQVYESGQYWTGTGDGVLGFVPNGFTYSAQPISTRTVTTTKSIDGPLSADGQDINPRVTVTYQLEAQEAESFYSNSEASGPYSSLQEWETVIAEPAINQAAFDAASDVSALALVESYDTENGVTVGTLRQELRTEVRTQLREETRQETPEINIIEVRLEDPGLSEDLDSRLEQIAIEEAEAERRIVEANGDAEAEVRRAEGDAEAAVARAEGDAEAAQQLIEAYGGVEAAQRSEWITAIDEDDGTIVLDAEAAPLLDLDPSQNDNIRVEDEDESSSSSGDDSSSGNDSSSG